MIDENSEEFHAFDCELHSFGDHLAYGFQRRKHSVHKFIEYDVPKTHLKQLIDLGEKCSWFDM
jgi:hypothetical protein